MYPLSECTWTFRKLVVLDPNKKLRILLKQSSVLSLTRSKQMPRGIITPVETAVCAINPFLFAFTCVVYFRLRLSIFDILVKNAQILSSSRESEIIPSRSTIETDRNSSQTISSRCCQSGVSLLLFVEIWGAKKCFKDYLIIDSLIHVFKGIIGLN